MLEALGTRKIQNLSLVTIAITCLGGLVYFLRGVLVPFTMALFLYFVISPVIEILVKKLRLPRNLALLVALLIGGVLLLSAGGLVVTSLAQLSSSASSYLERFEELLWEGLYSIPESVGEFVKIGQIYDFVVETVSSIISTVTQSILDLLSQLMMVALFLLFFLLGEQREHSSDATWAEIARQTQFYVQAKAGVSAATAALVYCFLAVAQVDFALVLGLLTFLLNFIPNVGSLIAIVLPIPVIVLSPVRLSWEAALTVMVLIVLVQFVMGNVIEPKLLGDTLELHPVVVLVSLLVWGTLWGLIGMFLAVPITASLKIVFQKLALEVAQEQRAGIVDASRSTLPLSAQSLNP